MQTPGTTLALPVLNKVFSDIPDTQKRVEEYLSSIASPPASKEELRNRIGIIMSREDIIEGFHNTSVSLREIDKQFLRLRHFVSADDEDFV